MIGRPSKRLYKFMMKDWFRLKDLEACKKVLETKRFNRNLQPLAIDYPEANNILVIAPHPDDDIIGSGGTLIKAKNNGSKIDIVYVTNGIPEKSEEIRKETLAVCNKVGFTPHFLDCQSRNIPIDNKEVNNRLIELINRLNPEAIFISFLLDDHDDHRRVNQLLLKVLNKMDLPLCEIWSYQVYSTIFPNVVVDITKQKEQKRELIQMWENVGKFNDLSHYILGINASNCIYMKADKPIWVESFFVVPIKEYLSLCDLYLSSNDSNNYYFSNYLID